MRGDRRIRSGDDEERNGWPDHIFRPDAPYSDAYGARAGHACPIIAIAIATAQSIFTLTAQAEML
jgi:hypothetical protein